jgi:hypothetical protein
MHVRFGAGEKLGSLRFREKRRRFSSVSECRHNTFKFLHEWFEVFGTLANDTRQIEEATEDGVDRGSISIDFAL